MDPNSGSHLPFLDLLNSQETQHLPIYSSQMNLNFSGETQPNPNPIPIIPEKRRKWSVTEDVVLCSAWLNTSKDAIVSNEQKNTTFWNRVAAYFNASPTLKGLECRVGGHCKQRWQKINEGVSKFVGAYEAATRHKSSGQSEDDILRNAYKIYQQDHKLKFNLEHAWLELRHDQKWCSSLLGNVEGNGKRRKLTDEEGSSKSIPDSSETRPIGVKASKGNGKKKPSVSRESVTSEAASLAYQNMWSIKEKDMELKKSLGKSKMLESLLAKTSQLSELEIKLKDKLITEMLNE